LYIDNQLEGVCAQAPSYEKEADTLTRVLPLRETLVPAMAEELGGKV